MVSFEPRNVSGRQSALGLDRFKLRLAVLGVLVVALFVALFSRLWFLQVLASEEYRVLAQDNRVRRVHSEPERGRILDRDRTVLVDSRPSLAVTVDRQVVDTRREERRTLRRLSNLLELPRKDLRENLHDGTVSPYKPVAVANDVLEESAVYIGENNENLPGVAVEQLPVRHYPRGATLAQVLGYVNEITQSQLESDHFKGTRVPYAAGDIVGQAGLEYNYDSYLRGRPAVRKVIVNSVHEVVSSQDVQEGRRGRDLILSIDADIQRLTESALADGILTARGADYEAPTGGVVVMDPNTGGIVAMSSYPTYDPSMLADGITVKEFDSLGGATPNINTDDQLLNRAIQGGFPSGSTFKVVTAGAAMWSGIADPYTYLSCPGSVVYPPEGGPGSVVYPNWTSADFGTIGFPTSLEISCDTFYYELGWRMEDRFGAANGDGSEKFQDYMRMAGFGHETGIDLPNEFDGRVPDEEWCRDNEDIGYCPYGWLPGYTVNMSIGQGDLLVTPLQMAVTMAAIANDGNVMQPRVADAVARVDEFGDEEIVRDFQPKVVRRLPLDATELGVIQQGLVDVISGANGTATSVFAGFPTDRFPLAGKTGTAQIGETDLNYAWFISYAPADAPEYVIAAYLERAGHGGESAAPIARQIYEGIFGIDQETDVRLGSDASN